ncbi:tail length tape-measure protein [Aeromonas phage Akh-2]|nr:tail length tape-measure protein [Aeromonas phage Akh-2]
MNILAVDSSGNPVPGASGPSQHGQSYILKDDDGTMQFWVYHGFKNQQASSVLVNKARNQEFYLQSLNNIGPEYWNENYMLLDT